MEQTKFLNAYVDRSAGYKEQDALHLVFPMALHRLRWGMVSDLRAGDKTYQLAR